MSDSIPQEMTGAFNTKFSNEIYRMLVDHKELISEQFRILTGFEVRYDEMNRPVLVEGAFSIMNRVGAMHIYNFLRSSVNALMSLTDWESENILFHLKARMDGFTRVLYDSFEDWGISSAHLPNIVSGMRQTLHASLRMALDGQHRKSVTETINKSYQELVQKEPKSSIIPFKR